MRKLRTLLALGRVSNLPTVWSNGLAAWLLAGGRPEAKLAFICAGGSCLYLGGMFLNDACDVGFDRRHRMERPIPAGAISRANVFVWSAVWLALGMTLLLFHGKVSLPLAVMLLLAITTYNFLHKIFPPAIVLMAACRFLLYLVAASAVVPHLPVPVLTGAAAIAIYVLGISLLARNESIGRARHSVRADGVQRTARPTVIALLFSPLLLTAVNCPKFRLLALIIPGLLFAGWIAWSLRPAFGSARAVGPAVGRLLAGIVLLDWLNVTGAGGGSPRLGLIYIALFLLTLRLQKRVAAT